MNINSLWNITSKPELYSPGNAVMWTDPHISGQLLPVHLDTETDLASRKSTTINSTITWMFEVMQQAWSSPLDILDLGCGPGLYTRKLASLGHRVTGMDFSFSSIAYAKEQAKQENLNLNYLCENYLEADLQDQKFDLIIMIFTDFSVLRPKERRILLQKVRSLLKPNGRFIFDVVNDKDFEERKPSVSWEWAETGFWRPSSYLLLSRDYLYSEEKVILQQHIVVEDSKKPAVYRFWNTFFSQTRLKEELIRCGFDNFSFHNDVLPASNMWDGEYITFVTAQTG